MPGGGVPGGRGPMNVVSITASAAASVAAAAKESLLPAQDNPQINEAVSKVLQGYDWTLVPVVTK